MHAPRTAATAITAWREVVGHDHVVARGEARDRANRATFATTQQAIAVVAPGSRDEVVACLAVANRHRVPVYPVSTGRNWGYGSRVAPRDGCAVLALHRLDRIVDYDEDLAYVTVEPGVTFSALRRFLDEQGSRLLPPETGGPDGSLVGTALERGIGKGPYEDLAAHTCAYEVLTATGETVRTGRSSGPAGPLVPPPGPAVEGLFEQSNLGIVSRMTVRLHPAPALRQFLTFDVPTGRDLGDVVDRSRLPLLRQGHRLQMEVRNDFNLLMATRSFPYHEFDGSAVLPRAWARNRLQDVMGGRWLGGATLWADSQDELERRRLDLAESLDRVVHAAHEPAPGLSRRHDGSTVESVYWRKRTPAPDDPDPDRDRVGLIWMVPVLPAVGAEVAGAAAAVEAIMGEHGFEPSLALRLGGRAVHVVIGIVFDREEPSTDSRADRCRKALSADFAGRGWAQYRLDVGSMSMLDQDRGAGAAIAAVRSRFDPHAILAPGRYEPA